MSTSIDTALWQRDDLARGAATEVFSITATAVVTTQSETWVDVPGLSLSVTQYGDGLPVILLGSLSDLSLYNDSGGTGGVGGRARLVRESTALAVACVYVTNIPDGQFAGGPNVVLYTDAPPAGTYTYKVQWLVDNHLWVYGCSTRSLQAIVFVR